MTPMDPTDDGEDASSAMRAEPAVKRNGPHRQNPTRWIKAASA